MSDASSIIDAPALGVAAVFNAASHFVDRHVDEGRGTTTAIECGDDRVSYVELLERVNQLGRALRERLAVRSEERVALLLLDTPYFFYSFFGAIKAGAVAVPINTLWTPADYEYVLADSRARVVIVSEELVPRLTAIDPERRQSLEHVVIVPSVKGEPAPAVSGHVRTWHWSDLVSGVSTDLDAAATSRDDAAFWLYSSGSTGRPKGCVHLHHDMVVCAELYAKGVLGARESDRFFSVPKLFFAYGLGNGGYFPLAVGGTSILWPGPPTAANVYAVIERHRPTLFFSVPTGYGMLLAHDGEFDLSSVRLASSAGEALPAALYERFKQRFGIDILDGIGSTEVLHTFISNRPDAIRPGSSGLVVPGYDAKLVDESGAPVPRGDIGNLWIAGDSICAGYWNQHEKTKQTIHGPWIRTGDKYTQDADGYYWYAGRSDDMLKVGGLWVSPIEVEHALVQHPAVLECAVVAREDHDTLVKPAAFVVVRAGHAPSPALADDLLRHVRARLADYKRPRWIEFVPELPKTATGKIQRYKLKTTTVTYDIGALLDAGRAGAYQRWLVFLTALAIVFDGIDNQLLGVVIPTLMNEWEVARSAFAPVVSLGIAGMMVGGALAGIAGDRFGRRRALLASMTMFGAMTLAIAAVDDLSTLAALRFLAGIGLGGAIPNAATLAAEFVPRAQRPMAVTSTIVCVPLGAMLAGLLGSQLLSTTGWRVLFVAGGLVPLVAVVALARLLPESPRFLARHPARWPELVQLARKLGHQVSPNAAFEDAAEGSVGRAAISSLFGADLRRDTLALWVSFCSCLLAVYLGFSWLPAVLTEAGFGPGVASTGITAFNLGGVVGALASGAVMSRIGSRAAMLTMAGAAIAGAITLSRMTISINARRRSRDDHADHHRGTHQRDPDDDVCAGDERLPERRARDRCRHGDGGGPDGSDPQRLCRTLGARAWRKRLLLHPDCGVDGGVPDRAGQRQTARREGVESRP